MKRIFAALLMGTALLATSHAAEVEGVKLPETQSLGGETLVLNGAGVRTKFFVKVYVAGLYLPKRASTTAEVLAQKGAKRIAVTLLREFNSKELGDLLIDGLRKNATRDEMNKIGMSIVRVGEMFGSIPVLKKGDAFSIDYVPGKGAVFAVNGKTSSDVLPEEEFMTAMLKIWLGDKPADTSLKPLLLGQKPAETVRRDAALN